MDDFKRKISEEIYNSLIIQNPSYLGLKMHCPQGRSSSSQALGSH